MEEEDEEEVNLLDLYDQVVSLRVAATMPESTNKKKQDRFAARVSEARAALNLEDDFGLDIVNCQICRGRGCVHCRVADDHKVAASESDATLPGTAQPTEVKEATQAEAERALIAASKGQARLSNGQPTPPFLQALVEAVLTNVDSSMWAGPSAKELLARSLEKDLLSSTYHAKQEDSNLQRSHRRRMKFALRGEQLLQVGHVFFLAMQPELHSLHDQLLQWCQSRLALYTGVVVGEVHSLSKLSTYQDHLVFLEAQITTASSTLSIEELNAIFQPDSYIQSATKLLQAVVGSPVEDEEPDGTLSVPELCQTVTQYVPSLRAIGNALRDGSAFFEYGAKTSVLQDWVDGLQYLWILALHQMLDQYSKEMADDQSSQRSKEEEATAAQEEWAAIEASQDLKELFEKVTSDVVIDDSSLEPLAKDAVSRLKLSLGKVLLTETKERVRLEIEKLCVDRIAAGLPSRYSNYSRETLLGKQTKQTLLRRELSPELLAHIRGLCRDSSTAAKQKDKQAEAARMDLRDNVLPWICSRSHANELNLYFEVLNPESTARPGLEVWVEANWAGVLVAGLCVLALLCIPMLGVVLLVVNIRRPFIEARELESRVEFEEHSKFRSFTWRVVAMRTLRQALNVLLDSCGFQSLAGLFGRSLAAVMAWFLLALPVVSSILIRFHGRDGNWVAPVVIGFQMVATWCLVLAAFVQRRILTQANQQMNSYTLDGRRVPDQMRKNWQNKFEVLLTAVGVAQFLSPAFEPSVPWPEQSSDSVGGFLSIFVIDFSFLNTMEVSFSLLVGMLVVWLFGVHVTASSGALASREIELSVCEADQLDSEVEAVKESVWARVCRITAQYVMPALGGAFYMVYVKWLCRAFDCDYGESNLPLSRDSSTDCFQDLHLAWTVLSLCGFSVFVPQATLTTYVAFVPDENLDLLTRPLFLIFTNLLRLPLGVATVLLVNTPQVHTSFSMAASMALAVYVKWYQPMSVGVVNTALVISYLAASWINLCALVATFLDEEEDWVLLYFMFGVACLFVGLAAAWTVQKTTTLAIIAGIGFFSATIMAVIVQVQFSGEDTTTITILFLVSCLLLLFGIFIGRTLTYKCLVGDPDEEEDQSRFSELSQGAALELHEIKEDLEATSTFVDDDSVPTTRRQSRPTQFGRRSHPDL